MYLFVLTLLSSQIASAYDKVLSVGLQSHDAQWDTGGISIDASSDTDTSYHLGFRIYNHVGTYHLFGVGIDIDEIIGERLIGYRALDYQGYLTPSLAVGGFFGAASIDTGLPQNGYYYGFDVTWYVFSDTLAASLGVRKGDGLARDRRPALEPTDNPERPDIFLDYTSLLLAVKWHF